MPYNLLLLPLLGGFIFIWQWNVTRYHAARSQNERLLIYSAIAGLVFLIAAFFITVNLKRLWPGLSPWWYGYIPFPYSGTAGLAFLLGALVWIPLNWLFNRESNLNKIVAEDGDRFEILLMDALHNDKMVSITLKNNKTYYGKVISQVNPVLKIKSVSIMPYWSGYRDQATKMLHFTTDYQRVYEEFMKELGEYQGKLNLAKALRREVIEQQANLSRRLSEARLLLAPPDNPRAAGNGAGAHAEGVQHEAASKEGLAREVGEIEDKLSKLRAQRLSFNVEIRELEVQIEEVESRSSDYETIVPADEISILSIHRRNLYEQYFTRTEAGFPIIDEVTPARGMTGSKVSIKGSNFAGTAEVSFNGAAARSFVIVSPEEIKAVVPDDALSGPVSVSTPRGEARSSGSFSFLLPPTVSGVTPTGGAAGSKVQIIGANLIDATGVEFNGLSAAFEVDSAMQITATVPAGAASGPVAVKTLGGTAISPGNFTISS
jgi:hypothetical protein